MNNTIIEGQVVEETTIYAEEMGNMEEIKVTVARAREFRKGMDQHYKFAKLYMDTIKEAIKNDVSISAAMLHGLDEAVKDEKVQAGAEWFSNFLMSGDDSILVASKWIQGQLSIAERSVQHAATALEKTGHYTGLGMIKTGVGLVWLGNKLINGGVTVQTKTSDWADKMRGEVEDK